MEAHPLKRAKETQVQASKSKGMSKLCLAKVLPTRVLSSAQTQFWVLNLLNLDLVHKGCSLPILKFKKYSFQ